MRFSSTKDVDATFLWHLCGPSHATGLQLALVTLPAKHRLESRFNALMMQRSIENLPTVHWNHLQ